MAISLVENGKKKEGFIDFTPYFNKIKHKLIWCLVVVVVAAAASWILTRFMSSSYTATATVLFKAQSQDVTPLPRLENEFPHGLLLYEISRCFTDRKRRPEESRQTAETIPAESASHR